MTDDDFRAIVDIVEQRLREVGAGELANSDLYVRRDEEVDAWRRLSPREHLLDMLKAFNRWLAVRDGVTYGAAKARINDVIKDGRLADVVVKSTGETDDGATVSLSEVPFLGDIRNDLRELIERLREAGETGGGRTLGA